MILKKVKNEIGATAIEYGLIASLVAVVAVSGMSAVGRNLSNTYCTISKHLGGSGTCSGSFTGNANGGGSTGGSNSTGGNGNAGSSTGSVNSTNSYAEGATMDDVNNSLKDQLDSDHFPTLYGGNDYAGAYTIKAWDGDAVPTFAEYMRNINATDPITNVFGAYNADTGTPVTDYNTVLSDLQSGGSTIRTGHNGDGNILEVTTASGKVYSLQADHAGFSPGIGTVTQKENPSK
ncbi:Flp family type IVb pilin [Acetobacter lambici]|uniref:Flp family type IVb pilin n=1 Tax=Acetobacter lambici TaxID=1332824 RepID=A0ABT1F2F0_9PROT|nr:Flp family type IVb pilin [Acetobacter lambici]MCP1243398.1 Flp family type IVb pilin [Acetobacter lambici]MCP1259397.1 Flp family type IVb pilin [Acetobacter lambici]NHO57659.1 Flp family type IVb pilin [Acetobacter lambici]